MVWDKLLVLAGTTPPRGTPRDSCPELKINADLWGPICSKNKQTLELSNIIQTLRKALHASSEQSQTIPHEGILSNILS